MHTRACLRCAVVWLAAGVGLAAQTRASRVPLKTYRDTVHGVTLQYPAIAVPGMGTYGGSFLLLSKDGYDPYQFKVGLTSYSAGDNKDEFQAATVTFTYAVLPLNEAGCRARAATLRADEEEPSDATTIISGIPFAHAQLSDAGLGHGWGADTYIAFAHRTCYGFELMTEGSRVDELPRDKHGRPRLGGRALDRSMSAFDRILNSVRITAPGR